MFRTEALTRFLVLCGLASLAVPAMAQKSSKAVVIHPDAFAVSQPLRELPIDVVGIGNREMPEPLRLSTVPGPGGAPDQFLQKEVLPAVSATVGVTFSGLGAGGFAPSDSNLAVGPNHVVETVNVQFAVYSKTGTLLSGPTNFTTLFSALNNHCSTGASDPIVNYDRLADRWVISDMGYTGGSPFPQCFAVSKTNDPTGAYFLYSFTIGTNLGDYPKIGVWPTASNAAYLSSYNLFNNGGPYNGVALCGFDRTKALAGDSSATQLCQTLSSVTNEFSYLPSDLDGPTAPTDGTPGLFLSWGFYKNVNQLYLRKLTLNFSAGTSSLSSPTTFTVSVSGACSGSGGTCVPQSGTTQQLDTLGDRLMYRFPVRHFADHDRAVANHSVANGSPVAIHWYEFYDPAGSVTLNQQGTFAPDSTYRWMGSIAEDKNADIALAYSASSSSIHPSIRFTGRVPSDPTGSLETEASILTGPGSQTSGLSRWGDYTSLQVDPSDDCTFWYVDQYEPTSGTFNWGTNIASFSFTGCGGGGTPGATLSATKLNLGKVPVSMTSKAKSVTLTNNGSATLNISSISISGDYAISANTCGSTLAVGANCKVSVTFTPTATGLRKGTLSFNDNAPGSPQTVALTGTGTSLALTPASWSFGSVKVGQQSASKTFTLTNETSSSVSSVVVSLAGTNPGQYQVTSNGCGSTLSGNSSCSITVVFKPTVTGSLPAQLKVTSTGVGSPNLSKLAGKGA